MKLWILGRIAALLGIQFKVDGLPYGARMRPNVDASAVSAQHGASDNSEQDQPKG